jgi:uncharacterized protein
MTYVDASVLLRVVLREESPLATWRDISPVSSELIRFECLRLIDRARAAFGIDDQTSSNQRAAILTALSAFALAQVSAPVLERAADPFPTALGTLDAIHLATALQLRQEYADLAFATHDRELATAARSVGFTVDGA